MFLRAVGTIIELDISALNAAIKPCCVSVVLLDSHTHTISVMFSDNPHKLCHQLNLLSGELVNYFRLNPQILLPYATPLPPPPPLLSLSLYLSACLSFLFLSLFVSLHPSWHLSKLHKTGKRGRGKISI